MINEDLESIYQGLGYEEGFVLSDVLSSLHNNNTIDTRTIVSVTSHIKRKEIFAEGVILIFCDTCVYILAIKWIICKRFSPFPPLRVSIVVPLVGLLRLLLQLRPHPLLPRLSKLPQVLINLLLSMPLYLWKINHNLLLLQQREADIITRVHLWRKILLNRLVFLSCYLKVRDFSS